MLCIHKKRNGQCCRANALPGKHHCTFHDPELEEERAEGRRRGGVNRSQKAATLPPDTQDLSLMSVADVVGLLGQTINQVRTGQLDARVGNCLFVGAGVLLKALQGEDMEQRIAALESALKPRPTRRRHP
jgi:hypothetical protein